MSRDGWGYYTPTQRRAVEGGVAVAKPGKVSHPLAIEMVEAAEMEAASSSILARGRTYARAGQVVAVQVESETFAAQIQGSERRPYNVRLERVTISGSDRVAASCDCPYGCDFGWCKHAAALAYVAAFLLDSDPSARAAWTGALLVPPAQESMMVDDAVLAVLRRPLQSVDGDAMLAAASAIVPHPWAVEG